MKIMKYMAVLALLSMLTACGHGFKGEWHIAKVETGNPFADDMATAMMNSGDMPGKFTLGANYIEEGGMKTQFDKIKVVKRSGEKQLVFIKNKKEEFAWSIENKRTLVAKDGREKVIFTRSK